MTASLVIWFLPCVGIVGPRPVGLDGLQSVRLDGTRRSRRSIGLIDTSCKHPNLSLRDTSSSWGEVRLYGVVVCEIDFVPDGFARASAQWRSAASRLVSTPSWAKMTEPSG